MAKGRKSGFPEYVKAGIVAAIVSTVLGPFIVIGIGYLTASATGLVGGTADAGEVAGAV